MKTFEFSRPADAAGAIATASKSKTAQVSFSYSAKSIRLRIVDQGIGFDAPKLQKVNQDDFGSGLSGIRDRVSLWGGQFAIHSKPGAGTTLDIKIPGKRHSTGEKQNG